MPLPDRNESLNAYLSFFLSTFFNIMLQAVNAFSAAVKTSSIEVPADDLESAARAARYSSAKCNSF